MELLKWDEEYSVGVSEIDSQHQQIFVLINKLIGALSAGGERDTVRSVLEEMINYVDYHFGCEEKLLSNHPDFSKHRHEHVEFVKKTLKLQGDFLDGAESISWDVVKFLISWLKNHILGTDQKFFKDMANV